jgi:hypothetical protein
MQAAFRPSFQGKDVPLTDAQKTGMQDLEPVLRNGIIEAGLHVTNCIDPPDGFVKYLVGNSYLTTKDLVYSASASSVSINSKTPTEAEFIANFVAAGIALHDFKWADAVQELHKARFYGRVAMLYDETVRSNVKSNERVEIGESDEPIKLATSENCAQEYYDTYGERMDPSKVPQDVVLGKMYRGFASKNIPDIRVANVCTQDTYDQLSLNDVGLDNGNLVAKKKDPKLKVGTPENFLAALWMLLMGFVYVGVSQIADVKDWKGPEDVGMAGGKRRQFSRAGAVHYYDFFRELAKQFAGKDVSTLVYLELSMRKKWKDIFARGYSLESCMRASLTEHAGVTFAKAAMAKRKDSISPGGPATKLQKLKGGPPSGGPPSGGPPGGPPTGQSAFERAKAKSDFNPNIRTSRFTKDKKPICVGFNIKDGCKWSNCTHEHVCDVKLQDGTACGEAHTRLQHV